MDRKMIGQGRTADIFCYGNGRVLKLFKAGIPQQIAKQEYEINQIVGDKPIPAPKAYELVQLNGRSGIVYEYIDGKTMLSNILDKPWKVIRAGHQLAELHIKIHVCDSDQLPSLGDKLREDIMKAASLTTGQKNNVLSYLGQLEGGTIVCHGDLHPDNILIDGSRHVVIDWLTSASGNPAADVARTFVLLTYGSAPPGITFVASKLLILVRRLLVISYLNKYKKISGMKTYEWKRWLLPVAAARLNENLPLEEKEELMKIVEMEIGKIIQD